MSEARQYAQPPPAPWRWSATIVLMAVNAVVYFVEYFLLPHTPTNNPFENTFALSLGGLRDGRLWQLITYQFLHAGFLHLFFNMWAVYVFGRALESLWGKGRMLALYFASGVAGGLLQMFCTWIWPAHFGLSGIVGASAGAMGLVAAFAVLLPDQRLLMLLFFVIPLAMRARTLLLGLVGLSVAGLFVPQAYSNIGHAAHLGGLATGFLIARRFMHGRRLPPIVAAEPNRSLKITAVSD